MASKKGKTCAVARMKNHVKKEGLFGWAFEDAIRAEFLKGTKEVDRALNLSSVNSLSIFSLLSLSLSSLLFFFYFLPLSTTPELALLHYYLLFLHLFFFFFLFLINYFYSSTWWSPLTSGARRKPTYIYFLSFCFLRTFTCPPPSFFLREEWALSAFLRDKFFRGPFSWQGPICLRTSLKFRIRRVSKGFGPQNPLVPQLP